VAQRVGRGIALLFHDHGTRRELGVSSTPWPNLPPRKDLVPIVQEAGWAPGPVWTGGKSRPTGIGSLDRPARSQSLYRQSYRAHIIIVYYIKIKIRGCILLLKIRLQTHQIILMNLTYVSKLTFKRRIKSHLPFEGIIRSSPYYTRFQDKG
jgi:hypothetical protein